MLYPYHGILLSREREWTPDTDNTGESQLHYAEWKKPYFKKERKEKPLWKSEMGSIWKNRGSREVQHSLEVFGVLNLQEDQLQNLEPARKVNMQNQQKIQVKLGHPPLPSRAIPQLNQVTSSSSSSQQLHKTVLCYCQLSPCWSSWQAQN